MKEESQKLVKEALFNAHWNEEHGYPFQETMTDTQTTALIEYIDHLEHRADKYDVLARQYADLELKL